MAAPIARAAEPARAHFVQPAFMAIELFPSDLSRRIGLFGRCGTIPIADSFNGVAVAHAACAFRRDARFRARLLSRFPGKAYNVAK
jgi:hypothetical protein